MKKVTVSAPGKLHLSGEHAVVHGKPAVVVSTSKRMFMTLQNAELRSQNSTRISDLRKKDIFVNEIIKKVEGKYKTSFKDTLSLTIHSDIPIGSGMGSSAALAVTLVAALVTYLGRLWSPQEINELAFQAEKLKHVNASGSDPTIVTYGGILWYRKELDFLKTFWLLPFKFPKKFSPFMLINTGREETTGDLVTHVGRLREENENAFILLITQIEEITRQLVKAIHDENEKQFRPLIQMNEKLLEKMGVVSTSTQAFIRAIEKAGGVAKISGAGGIKNGSGIVIAAHDDLRVITKVAEKYKYPFFQTILGGEGVRLEQVTV